MSASRIPLPSWAHLVVPAGLIVILAAMVVPVPPVVLDLLISVDIALSLVVLLSAVYVPAPVDFSAFPSMLLLLTIYRLALNVASTRLILLRGAEGTGAAGHVIQAFGQFVVGGNVVVGLVVFLVLLAIQFVVINHGATRISEVTARFTLDAMPGKQMAIDADLNAGLISDAEARERRKAVAQEAEFYGSMDGAVRFTQRDAVAALIITGINIVGGLLIGVLQQGMALTNALSNYTILTVGDGLVTAVPALLVSVAAGLITSRASTGNTLGEDVIAQIFASPRPLRLAAGALTTLALVPGLPKVAFLSLGTACFFASRAISGRTVPVTAGDEAPPLPTEEPVEPLLSVDPLMIEVGYDLIGCVGTDGSGGVLDKIRGIRRQIAIDLGFVLPPVRIRDNLRLAPDQYSILLRGVEIATFRIRRGCVLAISPGGTATPFEGTPTIEPAFGIEAIWVAESRAEDARMAGCTVVDAASVVSTHLIEIIRRHSHELLAREDVQKLLDLLAKTAPKTVEELVPERLTLGQVQGVLRALLRERVPIRDLGRIVEVLADAALVSREPTYLVERVRQAIGRTICAPLLTSGGELEAVMLDPRLEQGLESLLRGGAPEAGEGRSSAVSPAPASISDAHGIVAKIARVLHDAGGARAQAAVLCAASVRPYLAGLATVALPHVTVLSPQEVPTGTRVRAIGVVSGP